MKKFTFLLAILFALLTNLSATTHHLYIENQTGWEQTALYAWADGRSDILGGWPGIQAAGTVEKDGVSYLDFQVDATVFPANFIFNNNGAGSQLGDYYIEVAGDYYLLATATGIVAAGTTPEPEPELDNYNLYVDNQTGWAAFYLYAWGDKEVFGGWPGMVATETTEKDGITYSVYPFTATKGSTVVTYHLIFHNNIGEGVEGDMRQLFDITEARDYYLTVKADGITENYMTAVESVIAPQGNAKKIISNGQLLIVRDGNTYNVLGAKL